MRDEVNKLISDKIKPLDILTQINEFNNRQILEVVKVCKAWKDKGEDIPTRALDLILDLFVLIPYKDFILKLCESYSL